MGLFVNSKSLVLFRTRMVSPKILQFLLVYGRSSELSRFYAREKYRIAVLECCHSMEEWGDRGQLDGQCNVDLENNCMNPDLMKN